MIKTCRFTMIATLCTLLLSPVAFAKSNRQSLDGIAAIVNDTAVTQSEVDTAANSIKAQMRASNTAIPAADVLQKKVLEQVIDRKLQLQAASQAGIKVSDMQVDQTINNIAKENNVSADVLYNQVATQGLSRTEYRNEIRDELTLQQIQQQQVASKVMMNPEDVKEFMHSREWAAATTSAPAAAKEYHVEDLVVLMPENADAKTIAAAKAQAKTLFNTAKQNANHDVTVNPTDAAVEKNDLGWRKMEELPSAFANQVAAAKKGALMEPVQTGNGFHIIHLLDIRQEKVVAENTAPAPTEKDAQQMVYQRKFAEALKKWVAKLRSQAVINTHPDQLV